MKSYKPLHFSHTLSYNHSLLDNAPRTCQSKLNAAVAVITLVTVLPFHSAK
jgi:hypothetical protein